MTPTPMVPFYETEREGARQRESASEREEARQRRKDTMTRHVDRAEEHIFDSDSDGTSFISTPTSS